MTDRPRHDDPMHEDPIPEPADERVTAFLRERHAPPGDERYWDSLEAEILARAVAGDAGAWWAIPPRWGRAGLVAAGIALLAAGLAVATSREAEARRAFAEVMSAPAAVQVEMAAQASAGIDGREATLRYLISH
jgi:hypothetical protein